MRREVTLPGRRGLLNCKNFDELLQKERYTVFEFRVGCLGRAPLDSGRAASIDQLNPVSGKKFLQQLK